MVIFGIDPGYAIVGCGIVRYEKNDFRLLGYGAVTTDKDMPFNERLKKIYDDLTELLEKFGCLKGMTKSNQMSLFV